MTTVTVAQINQAAEDFIADTSTADQKINGASGDVTDRHGTVTPNLQKILDGVPNAESDKVEAQSAAENAENSSSIAAQKAAESEVSAGAAAAHAAGAIYADEATGRAAVADGAYFFVEGATADQFYHLHKRIDVLTVTTALRTYPTLDYIQDNFRQPQDEGKRDLGVYFSAGPAGNYFSNVTHSDHGEYTLTAGSGDCWFYLQPTKDQNGATVVDVIIQVESGAIDNLELTQRDGGNAVLSTESDPVNEGNGIWATRSITLNGSFDAFRIRIKNTTGGVDAVIKMPQINTEGRQLTGPDESQNAAAAKTLLLTDKASKTNIFSMTNFSQIVGTGSTLAGRKITVPASNIAEGRVALTGLADAADNLTLVFKASHPFRAVNMTPHTGISGGASTNTSTITYIGGGFYMVEVDAEAAAGADAAYVNVRVDNRNNGPVTANDPLTVTHLWLGVNVDGVPAFITAPAAVDDLLGDAGVSAAYVDADGGDDSNGGTSGSPYATVAAAVAAGATKVFCRKHSTIHRLTSGVSLDGVDLIGFSKSGDTSTPYARIWALENIASGDFTATAADANVYYYATSDDPGAVWENVSDTLTRFGEVQSGGVLADYPQASADEAAVRSAAGRWWFGTGSEGEGLYLRPTGDTFTSKSYEISTADTGLSMIGRCGFDGVEIVGGRNKIANLTSGSAYSRDSRFAHSGTSDGMAMEDNAQWLDYGNCIFEDAGDDGVNLNGDHASFVSLGGSIFRNNVGDGIAPHGVDNNVRVFNAHIVDNGKQGFVTIGTGNYDLRGCILTGNADVDLLIRLGALTNATTVELHGNVSDSTEVSANTASTITGSITGHNGPLNVQADIDVKNHRSVGGGIAFNMDGGTVALDDFYYGSNTTGIDQSAGTLTAGNGQILRGSVGVNKTGGTITLNADDPINIPSSGTGAPTTRHTGLSAGEEATLANVAAV